MRLSRRQFLQTSGLAAAYFGLPAWLSGCATVQPQPLANPGSWASEPTSIAGTSDQSLQLIQRLTYGLAPGEMQRVAQLGAAGFINEQLHPERIDDSAMDRRLASFNTLAMSSAELLERYPGKGQQGPQEIIRQLQQASLLRAVYSKRQLQEIMVDVWSNHLNIFIGKGKDKWLKTADDRDVIRPHALGRFRDLLLASAKSPAMLFYLDNVENTVAGGRNGKGGLNENYARELMELHTIGADAGYDHDDIVAVARAFTGWSITRPQEDNPGSFVFRPRLHDNEAKQIKVLGLDVPAGGGIADGEAVIARLASDQRTARRIAGKLCVRFVADDPPEALVERTAQVYLDNDTDIRATLDSIFHSPEFAAAPPKIKQPMHAFASMLRVAGAQIEPSPRLAAILQELGQPFFGWPAPDGYPQAGAAWVNTGGMLARWNTAFALTEGRITGVSANLHAFVPEHSQMTATTIVDALSAALLAEPIGNEARDSLVTYAGGDGTLDAPRLDRMLPGVAGLILASPLFQIY